MVRPTDYTRGPVSAKVTIIEFGDYQCAFCRQNAEAVNQALAKYGDDVRHVWKDYPFSDHPEARPAAIAARCDGIVWCGELARGPKGKPLSRRIHVQIGNIFKNYKDPRTGRRVPEKILTERRTPVELPDAVRAAADEDWYLLEAAQEQAATIILTLEKRLLKLPPADPCLPWLVAQHVRIVHPRDYLDEIERVDVAEGLPEAFWN